MSGLPLRIRNFHREDLESLFEIDQVCFASDIAFSRAELIFFTAHPPDITRIAEDDGRIAGFVMARIERQNAHVLTLDVMPEYRRRGIGTRLMEDLHGELEQRHVSISILEVGVTNIPAQRLYERLGYQYRGTLIGYYRGREDAYRMRLELGGGKPTGNL